MTNDNLVKICNTCLHNHTNDKTCAECILQIRGKCVITYKMWEPKDKFNDISKPSHLYEPMDVIEDWGLDYNLGNVVRYIYRFGRKDSSIEDLEKAKEYIDFEIDAQKRKQPWNEAEMRQFILAHKEAIKEAIKRWEDDLK